MYFVRTNSRKGFNISGGLVDSCFGFFSILGLGFGGANTLPSLVQMTLDGLVRRRSILGSVGVGWASPSEVITFLDGFKPS